MRRATWMQSLAAGCYSLELTLVGGSVERVYCTSNVSTNGQTATTLGLAGRDE